LIRERYNSIQYDRQRAAYDRGADRFDINAML
jgi:hypothetical protein